MPAPHWFFRFMYDRESAAWERQRDKPEQHESVERTADELANVVAPHPAAFIADVRRCLRPGGHLLITAPARDRTSLTSQNLYWRLRAACYHLVPGVVRFYDTTSLPRLVEDQGLTVVECNGAPGRVSVLARA